MGIAISLQQYLDGQGVPYDVTTHERTLSSSETARASSISEDDLAKGVLVRREDGYLLAIVPAAACRAQSIGGLAQGADCPRE